MIRIASALVVVNEVRYRDEATEAYLALLGGVYPEGHPYRRAVGGTVDSVGAISFKDACAFADAHYTPENGVIVVSGDLTSEELKSALRGFLGRVAKRPTLGIRNPVPLPPLLAARATVHAPIDDTAILLAWPLPSEPLLNVRMRVLARAAAGAIDGAVSGRVQFGVVGDERASLFTVSVEVGQSESIDDVTNVIRKTLDRLPRESVACALDSSRRSGSTGSSKPRSTSSTRRSRRAAIAIVALQATCWRAGCHRRPSLPSSRRCAI